MVRNKRITRLLSFLMNIIWMNLAAAMNLKNEKQLHFEIRIFIWCSGSSGCFNIFCALQNSLYNKQACLTRASPLASIFESGGAFRGLERHFTFFFAIGTGRFMHFSRSSVKSVSFSAISIFHIYPSLTLYILSSV